MKLQILIIILAGLAIMAYLHRDRIQRSVEGLQEVFEKPEEVQNAQSS